MQLVYLPERHLRWFLTLAGTPFVVCSCLLRVDILVHGAVNIGLYFDVYYYACLWFNIRYGRLPPTVRNLAGGLPVRRWR